jgi:hypothetical protein
VQLLSSDTENETRVLIPIGTSGRPASLSL